MHKAMEDQKLLNHKKSHYTKVRASFKYEKIQPPFEQTRIQLKLVLEETLSCEKNATEGKRKREKKRYHGL